ncbi:MAG: hypothetical protein HYU28_00375 [Actinobacteria bacterium]|nr:hypothetical protein [Actinomycetota bacterium]
MTVDLIIKGLVAGAVGTVVMNLSSETEMNYRGRAASTSPGRAFNKLLSFAGCPVLDADGRALKILSSWTHYLYGTLWGLVLWAYFGELEWPIALAGPAFFLTVWLTEQVELPLLKIAPWSWTWGAKEVAIDLWHHVAYATGAVAAWVLLGVAGAG